MVLGYKKILKLFKKNILIKNANPQNLHSSSYDVTIGKYILVFKKNSKPISLIDANEINSMYERINISEGYKFKPGESILVVLEDEFNMPNNICGEIRGRTSFNRLGLSVLTQHLNPGFKGNINLTITNNSPNTYILLPKFGIAQAVFHKMDRKIKKEKLYSSEIKPSYQNTNGEEGSMIYNHFIGKVVRHFKGNYYYIENICMDSETKEYTVVYRTLYPREDSNMWVRPAKMFFEEIDEHKEGNVTGQHHRFEVVDDLTIDYTKK